ncbi:p43 [Maruca vitrata nucleopolyhedrovirus]|uniref:p43 n=1 Tax=Maruca vitrata nucleopolyhedrovirus TaxID=1307954 RepID=A1YR90_9ABAC|nr:p43 [Maruca vitrata nucleopolyhedrovirus]ABL75980.1 p43 [Maruca vitrata nucleopolyhedrovirus]
MDKRANSRKPFLFYNEDYYCEKPKRYFHNTRKVIFENFDSYATNTNRCKKLIMDFLDYCLPKYYRRKNKFTLLFRLLEPIIRQAGTLTYDERTDRWERQDNQYAHKWLIKVVGADMGQQIMFIIKRVIKGAKTCNLGFYNYSKLFRRCLSILLIKHKDVFVKCLQIILKAAMPIRNKGVVKSNYAFAITNALHYYIVENLHLLCKDINVVIKVRRLLIKHEMLSTEKRIKLSFEKCSTGIGVPLHKKLLLNYMMSINNDNLQWPSLMNIVESRQFDESNKISQVYIVQTNRYRPNLFKYNGWNEQGRFCRTENFCHLVNLQLNKDGTKKLKLVQRKCDKSSRN